MTPGGVLKIIRLVIENFKRIVAVDITPDKNIVILSGRNSQGKSSILDAIYAALKTREVKKNTTKPVRDGEESCFIQLDLGEYIVTRTITNDGKSRLRVETPAGEQIRSPQAVLDDITGSISLDPLKFIQSDSKDQVKQLTEAFNIDLNEFDAEHDNLYEERKLEKRELKAVESKLKQLMPPTESDPTTTVDIGDLNSRLQSMVTASSIQRKNHDRKKEIIQQIQSLKEEMQKIDDTWDDIDYNQEVNVIQEQIKNISSLNSRAAEVIQYNTLTEKRDTISKEIQLLTDKIELTNINKSEALESVVLPVDKLNIVPEGLMFGEIPFSQLSQSQQLKVAMAVVMAANPKLRVLRITQGSLMDDDNMAVIKKMAEEHDFQIWIEVVDPEGNVGICIEEGVVRYDANKLE